MIRLENISKTYQTDKVDTLALKDINQHEKKGDVGPSRGASRGRGGGDEEAEDGLAAGWTGTSMRSRG